jgi:crotonobetainyl-CoA:carnitine CoA-transferase CaiB-like acyl-CoA transferase
VTALNGITVLELAQSPAGEFCGKLLADFGAEVIKLEPPGKGSPTRHLGPFAPRGEDPERSGLFAYLNTNKRSAELDLESDAGRRTLQQLLPAVDAVIDDHPSGWLRAVGIDPDRFAESLPQLVLCSITAYGSDPPADRLHAQDLNVFHSSGWGYHTPSGADQSKPPLKGAGRFLPSYEAALDAALCVMAALFERQETRLGRFIDISAQQVLASRVDYVLAQMVAGDMAVGTERTAFDLAGPAGIYPCREGYAYIWMSAPAHWEALRKLLGDPDWMAPFPDNWLERECTPPRVQTCRRYVAAWLSTQDKHEAAAAAQELGLTLVAVNDARDLQASPQYEFRGYFAGVDHPAQGAARYPTVPYRLSGTPARIEAPAPLLGQHTEQALGELLAAGDTANRLPPGAGRTGAGPLHGVRVVELTKVWAGPYVGKLLAYLGAEVIRVESEGSLDVTRFFGVDDINNAPGFQSVNTQKLSVQINMKTEQGIALLLELIGKSDIVVENLRPGAIERLGLGYERVKAANPDIIYVSMGMYGSEGPLSYQTGYAPCFVALGGLSSLVGYEGEPPSGMNVRYADSTFGTMAANAALAALLHRRRGGAGQFIDVSAVESMSSMIGDTLMDFTLNGVVAACDGNRHPDMAPHGVYPCRDGEWISIAAASDEAWRALAAFMGQPELAGDAAYSSLPGRKAHEPELDALLARWSVQHSAAELVDGLQHCGVAAAKSQSSLDLIADPHLWARGFYQEVSYPGGTTKTTTGPSWKMSRAAPVTRGAPNLGQHNRYILGDILGLSETEQQRLAAQGVTR